MNVLISIYIHKLTNTLRLDSKNVVFSAQNIKHKMQKKYYKKQYLMLYYYSYLYFKNNVNKVF